MISCHAVCNIYFYMNLFLIKIVPNYLAWKSMWVYYTTLGGKLFTQHAYLCTLAPGEVCYVVSCTYILHSLSEVFSLWYSSIQAAPFPGGEGGYHDNSLVHMAHPPTFSRCDKVVQAQLTAFQPQSCVQTCINKKYCEKTCVWYIQCPVAAWSWCV